MTDAPVFIVEGDDPNEGPFKIKRYLGADWRPEPVDVNYGDVIYVQDWQGFEDWERELRLEYRKRGGWNGKLQCDPSRAA